MYRVALVEDYDRIAHLIEGALLRAGILVDRFATLSDAAFGLAHAEYTVMVVDRGLPDGDGIDLVRRCRAAGNMTPCLMLTARDALHDRIDGLESGADDYLTKPFAMDELVARVRSLIRRPAVVVSLTPAFGDVVVDPENMCLRRGDEAVSLAPAELQLMLCLVGAGGRTVRHTALEHAAWGLSGAVTPNALDVALHRLRKKMAAIESDTRILNMRGQGYALVEG
jgi:DNA-binding response OmpR family regulator